MRWFENLPMQCEPQPGLGAVSMPAATMGVLGFLAVSRIQTRVDVFFQRHALGLARLKEAQIQARLISRDLRSAIPARSIHEPAACERDLRVIRCKARPAAVLIVLTTRVRRGRPIFLRLTHISHSRLAVHEYSGLESAPASADQRIEVSCGQIGKFRLRRRGRASSRA